MRFKRGWVLFLFMLIVTITIAPRLKSQPSLPLVLTPPPIAIPASLFGMHIHYGLETWPNVPFYGWRLWDTYSTWADLEPQQGNWKFEQLDQYVEKAEEKNVEIVLTLGQSPQWASARPNDESPYAPGRSAEPANLNDWRNYIRTVATRYRGKIHYYELWNEPNYRVFYTGTVDKLVELAREAYTVLKEVDPTIVVLSPPFSGGGEQETSWIDGFLSKGGGNYADVIAYHFYPYEPEGVDLPESLAAYIRHIKTIMTQYEVANKPLWNTESGWLKPTVVEPDRKAMAYVARAYIINWAAGVQRFFWYAWDNRAAVSLYFTEADRKTPTPVSRAYAQIQTWLIGAQMQQCGADLNKTWVCQLSRQSQPFWIVWNPEQQVTFSIPLDWQVQKVQDLTGATSDLPGSRQLGIDLSPVLLFSPTAPS